RRARRDPDLPPLRPAVRDRPRPPPAVLAVLLGASRRRRRGLAEVAARLGDAATPRAASGGTTARRPLPSRRDPALPSRPPSAGAVQARDRGHGDVDRAARGAAGGVMAKWRWFAQRESPRAVRALELPAATGRPDLNRCPLHGDVIGPVTHLCKACFDQAWAEVGRRYATAVQGGAPTYREEDPTMTEATDETTVDEAEDGDWLPVREIPTTGLFPTTDPNVFLTRASEAATP